MGGASRFLQSTILFDWGFQSGFIVAGVANKSNWNLFFCLFFSELQLPTTQDRTATETSEQTEMMPGCRI